MQHYAFAPHKPLLHRFSVSESGDADALSATLAPWFGPTVIEPARGSRVIQARFNISRLKKIAVGCGTVDQAFSMKVANAGSFSHGFPIRGIGEHINNGLTVRDLPHKGALGAPGPMSLSYSSNFELSALFIGPQTLSNTLSALTGLSAIGRLELDKSNYESRPEAAMLRRLVTLMIAELDGEDPNLSPIVLAELEQAILVAFLCGTGHNYCQLLNGRPPSTGPWQLRRAEEYIEANWDQPITIEALAVIANASARSIFHSFKEHRGFSPMRFVKQVRLGHAREMLNKPNAATSVTGIAFACGFGNLGHFANDYLRAFGESPSATLNRSKGQP